jgi:hypothetical protein
MSVIGHMGIDEVETKDNSNDTRFTLTKREAVWFDPIEKDLDPL